VTLVKLTSFKPKTFSKASAEFEKVLELDPNYDTPILVLTPRAKISSEWGVLAFVYLTRGQDDSAKWALGEGRRRGGFTPFLCKYYSGLLNSLESNALYFSYGDEIFMYALYLQLIEHVREDVLVLNTEMQQVRWATIYYEHRNPQLYSSKAIAADTIKYVKWSTKEVKIPVPNLGSFTWAVEPASHEKYLLRSHLLLLDILTNNAFRRPVYFEDGTPETAALGLKQLATTDFLTLRLHPTGDSGLQPRFFESMKSFPINIVSEAHMNNKEERDRVLTLRSYLMFGIHKLDEAGRNAEAKSAFQSMVRSIPESVFPYEDEEQTNFVAAMREKYQ